MPSFKICPSLTTKQNAPEPKFSKFPKCPKFPKKASNTKRVAFHVPFPFQIPCSFFEFEQDQKWQILKILSRTCAKTKGMKSP